MRKSSFKKHIDQLNEEELRSELLELYDKVKGVKDHYKMELGSVQDRKKKYDQAKQEIAAKYKTKSIRRPRRPRIQKIRKILADLEKLSVLSFELIDVYLFDVETAMRFSIDYKFFSQVLENNIRNSLNRAVDLMELNRMEEEYKERCISILDQSRYIVGLEDQVRSILDRII